jgi:hypothetical protein
MAAPPATSYVSRRAQQARAMADDNGKWRLTRSRLFILIFFGIALLFAIMTIFATWEAQREGVVEPPAASGAAASQS